MPILVYWFEQSLSTGKPQITLEPRASFMSYQEGEDEYGGIPRSIQSKILSGEGRTKEEELVMQTLRLLEKATKHQTPVVALEDDPTFLTFVSRRQADPELQEKEPKVGDRVSVMPEDEVEYLDGKVIDVRDGFFKICFDDSMDLVWRPLSDCDFKFLPNKSSRGATQPKSNAEVTPLSATELSSEEESVVNKAERTNKKPPRVDEGTKRCKACHWTRGQKMAHDVTCPSSLHYDGPAQAPELTSVERKKSSHKTPPPQQMSIQQKRSHDKIDQKSSSRLLRDRSCSQPPCYKDVAGDEDFSIDDITSEPSKKAKNSAGTDAQEEDEEILTKDCARCQKGPASHLAHDITCPRSRKYTGKVSQSAPASTNQTDSKRREWTEEEDNIIKEAVMFSSKQPFTNWTELLKLLPARHDTNQVYRRWSCYLNPKLIHSPFTEDDNLALWHGHEELGKQWSLMSERHFQSKRSGRRLFSQWQTVAFKMFVAHRFGPSAYDDANDCSSC